MSGDARCADTFTNQALASHAGLTVSAGRCGGYIAWLGAKVSGHDILTCIYDSNTMQLAGARLDTDTDSLCAGSGATLPRECSRFETYAGDGGADALCWPSVMSGDATCADTFDTQVAAPHPDVIKLSAGACGGFLVWAKSNMRYDLACVYDPATKQYVGSVFGGNTNLSCLDAGMPIPRECTSPYTFPADGGTSQ